jgi:hypothetical protein
VLVCFAFSSRLFSFYWRCVVGSWLDSLRLFLAHLPSSFLSSPHPSHLTAFLVSFFYLPHCPLFDRPPQLFPLLFFLFWPISRLPSPIIAPTSHCFSPAHSPRCSSHFSTHYSFRPSSPRSLLASLPPFYLSLFSHISLLPSSIIALSSHRFSPSPRCAHFPPVFSPSYPSSLRKSYRFFVQALL